MVHFNFLNTSYILNSSFQSAWCSMNYVSIHFQDWNICFIRSTMLYVWDKINKHTNVLVSNRLFLRNPVTELHLQRGQISLAFNMMPNIRPPWIAAVDTLPDMFSTSRDAKSAKRSCCVGFPQEDKQTTTMETNSAVFVPQSFHFSLFHKRPD